MSNSEELAKPHWPPALTVFDARQGGDYSMAQQERGPNTLMFSVYGLEAFKEVLVLGDGDWADYVFDSTYQLMPTADLKSYIEENKHLPNIPSATEVYEQGIQLFDMNKRLLRKTEELTLYMLEQEERIKTLEDELQK